MPARSVLLALLVAVLWGGNFIALKLATQAFPPIFMAAMRFACVAALMLPFVKVPTRAMLPGILAVSFTLGGLHFGPMFTGLSRVEAATGAILSQLSVPFSALLATLLFKERLGLRQVAGIALAFAGVALLAGAPGTASDPLGIGLIVIGAACWAVANGVIKHFGPFDPLMLTGWMALFAAPQLLAVSLLVEHGQWQAVREADAAGWAAVSYIVLAAGVVGYTLWYSLLNLHPVSRIVPFALLPPVIAVFLAIPLLHEPLTWNLAVGGLLTVAGVGLCELDLRRLVSVRPRRRG
ncbi:DMT family transporter [Pseudomonas mangiferae]|uniref:EamA family transporter n=1 Tax=Pseudomonas mangiferae TaxID=2593654 RepID=A0A553GXB1_9PSED|nr:EamA family transporter [Pseudomonas mangiferae]TRX74152.1 EamA family transporter [Pseudomonas mangiferae]